MENNQPVRKRGFWKTFFIVVGIIAATFVALIIAVFVYLIIAKPFGVDITKIPAAIQALNSSDTTPGTNPMLNAGQEKFLQTLGVDPKTIPTTITAQQEACAVTKLGQTRVDELKAGATITPTDYFKANSCLK